MPHYTRQALVKAKNLRQEMTDAEKLLWSRIRSKQLLDKQNERLKFRRQVPIGHYIVDFYCHAHKLVIELDGSQHIENKEYDDIRTEFLSQQGIQVIRFWNNDVITNLEGVLSVILENINQDQ